MITKNVKYGISENVTIAEFGSGDIIVAAGDMIDNNNVGCLLLANDVPKEIGTEHPERNDKSTDEIKHDIIMKFNNVLSIDVVIDTLQTIKSKMINNI